MSPLLTGHGEEPLRRGGRLRALGRLRGACCRLGCGPLIAVAPAETLPPERVGGAREDLIQPCHAWICFMHVSI